MEIIYTIYNIENIVGGLYQQKDHLTDTLVLYGRGAPAVPDDGSLSVAQAILDNNCDVFVPDYIGSGRSAGTFTPENCVQTFIQLYTAFSNGARAIEQQTGRYDELKYKRIIVIGVSFAGAYVALLPQYNPCITELCLLYPVTDPSVIGTLPPEESNEDFLRVMRDFGYQYIFRGIEDTCWDNHLANKDNMAPINNTAYLENARLFVAHGVHDETINIGHTRTYIQKIHEAFPERTENYVFREYDGGHDNQTKLPAIADFFTWIDS